MKPRLQSIGLCLSLAVLVASTVASDAFALLGPIQPWMQATNGVINPGDIGGPMCLSNGYRWNVPVVTYGFDQSFLGYFGSNGVAAVESAIQILNNLPPASQLLLANYPFNSLNFNYAAQGQSLYDLKSQTLSLLLEHLGLAQPTRYIYVLHGWNPSLFSYQPQYGWLSAEVEVDEELKIDPPGADPNDNILNFVIKRNYDPETIAASPYVNGTLCFGEVTSWLAGTSGGSVTGENSITPYSVDLVYSAYTAVADGILDAGACYTGMTRDDVGGLAFLLSTNNINYETLLPGVAGVGTNANSFVNGAWRPGVDKITFIPQPMDAASGAFLTATNFFTDNYLTNGILVQQQLARVVAQPDFLFSAGDVASIANIANEDGFLWQNGATNWLNNAAANGSTNGAGPGVIQPPVHIVFGRLGPLFLSNGNVSGEQVPYETPQSWGSFNSSTNAPVVYPVPQTWTNQMTLRMWLEFGATIQNEFDWKSVSLPGAQFALQTSTNLIAWTTLFTVTNNGSVTTYLNLNPASASGFYRLSPQ